MPSFSWRKRVIWIESNCKHRLPASREEKKRHMIWAAIHEVRTLNSSHWECFAGETKISAEVAVMAKSLTCHRTVAPLMDERSAPPLMEELFKRFPSKETPIRGVPYAKIKEQASRQIQICFLHTFLCMQYASYPMLAIAIITAIIILDVSARHANLLEITSVFHHKDFRATDNP
jgi:hypothetical protein